MNHIAKQVDTQLTSTSTNKGMFLWDIWDSMKNLEQRWMLKCGSAVGQISWMLLHALTQEKEVVNDIEELIRIRSVLNDKFPNDNFSIDLENRASVSESVPNQVECDKLMLDKTSKILRYITRANPIGAKFGATDFGLTANGVKQWFEKLLDWMWAKVELKNNLKFDDIIHQLRIWIPVPISYIANLDRNPHRINPPKWHTWPHYAVVYKIDHQGVYILNPLWFHDVLPIPEFKKKRGLDDEIIATTDKISPKLKKFNVIKPNTWFMISSQ